MTASKNLFPIILLESEAGQPAIFSNMQNRWQHTRSGIEGSLTSSSRTRRNTTGLHNDLDVIRQQSAMEEYLAFRDAVGEKSRVVEAQLYC